MNTLRRFQDSHIALAHGNGGRFMRELIETLFAHHLGNELLDTPGQSRYVVPVNNC